MIREKSAIFVMVLFLLFLSWEYQQLVKSKEMKRKGIRKRQRGHMYSHNETDQKHKTKHSSKQSITPTRRLPDAIIIGVQKGGTGKTGI